MIIAQKSGRIPESTLADDISAFKALDIRMEDISELGPRILFYSKKYDSSVYDAAYLAIAEQFKADFVTANKAHPFFSSLVQAQRSSIVPLP